MFKFKSTLIALAILFIFISCVGNSYAFEIVEMDPADGSSVEVYYDSWYDYLPHGASLSTDEPYYAVSWYVDGVYVGTNGGGNPEDTEAYFGFYNLTGSSTGTTYTIRAEAWSIGTAENPSVSDTATYTLTVYAFEILEMGPNSWNSYDVYDRGGGANHAAELRTGRPYDRIEWYVDGTLYHTSYNIPGSSIHIAFCNISGLSSSERQDDDKITYNITHTIMAIAYPKEPEFLPVSESYEVTAYHTKYSYDLDGLDTRKDFPHVSGYVEITRHY